MSLGCHYANTTYRHAQCLQEFFYQPFDLPNAGL